jgi:hypothetical protein
MVNHKNNDNRSLVLYNRSGHARVASYSKPSSAFCANAKPDENWTLISDTGERRKIQNRISQRNYRKLICGKSLADHAAHTSCQGKTRKWHGSGKNAVRGVRLLPRRHHSPPCSCQVRQQVETEASQPVHLNHKRLFFSSFFWSSISLGKTTNIL